MRQPAAVARDKDALRAARAAYLRVMLIDQPL
jgi:hypothetical protein